METVTVQCAFTLALKAPRGADLSSLRALLSQALPIQAQCGQLRWARTPAPAAGWAGAAGTPQPGPSGSPTAAGRGAGRRGQRPTPSPQPLAAQSDESLCSYQDPSDGRWVPLPEDEALQRAWRDAASGPAGLRLQCWVRLGTAGGQGVVQPGPRDPHGAQLALQRPLRHRQQVAGLSSTGWWPSTATLPRGRRTWTCSRGTPWMSCAKVRQAAPSLSPCRGHLGTRGLCEGTLLNVLMSPCSGPGVAGGPL